MIGVGVGQTDPAETVEIHDGAEGLAEAALGAAGPASTSTGSGPSMRNELAGIQSEDATEVARLKKELLMFDVHCHQCERTYLVGTRSIVSFHNTSVGPIA